ncbi:L-histidine N(alpha)-methyltransferase [Nanoarchaeota archaeon]
MRGLKEIIESEIKLYNNIHGSKNDTENMSNHDLVSLDLLNFAFKKMTLSDDLWNVEKIYDDFLEYVKEINGYHINIKNSEFLFDFLNFYIYEIPNTEVEILYKKVINHNNQKDLIKRELFKDLKKQFDDYGLGVPMVEYVDKNYLFKIYKSELLYGLESQVQAFIDATETNEQYKSSIEGKLLMELMSKLNLSKKLEIIVLGSGSARHELAFIEELIDHHNIKKSSIYLTDISQTMVDLALYNGELFKNTLGKYYVPNIIGKTCDFNHLEQIKSIPLNPKRQKLFLFLGSTIGNLNYHKTIQTLDNIYQSMDIGDKLIVGYRSMIDQNEYEIDKNKMLEVYQTKEAEDFVYRPLEILGISREVVGDYSVIFHDGLIRTLNYYHSPRDITLSFTFKESCIVKVDDEHLCFAKGDHIQVVSSKRFYPMAAAHTFYCDTKLDILDCPYPELTLSNEKDGYAVSYFEKKKHDLESIKRIVARFCKNNKDVNGAKLRMENEDSLDIEENNIFKSSK